MTTGTPLTILVTGASSGFGALTVRALADAGHTVYAGMRHTAGRNAPAVAGLDRYAAGHGVSLYAVDLDVTSQDGADTAVARVLAEQGRLDVVVHNAGHMVTGPAEAFTPEQLADLYDVNVLGAQRVNRAALPALRERGAGLLVWIGSSSTRGGCPPFLGPYFAAKAAMDALAVSYAGELVRFGIDTAIVVPGAFTSGTNHFAHAGAPEDKQVFAAYEEGPDAPYAGFGEQIQQAFAAIVPPEADVGLVAEAIVDVVNAPFGKRPFRVHIDPSQDGADVGFAVLDRVRAEMLHRVGFSDLLKPREYGGA
jgi:NAD(P)-dependent dehydrogenase (short-subunit alcohol dehydrogenase family)